MEQGNNGTTEQGTRRTVTREQENTETERNKGKKELVIQR